jgi:bifunctional N-acetylglucosamine-1-phosphate-uridyltransferase/glucosamine-1-phosphate-acetyltransferase GlmU-like protein
VCLGEHLDGYPLEAEIEKVYTDAKIVRLDEVTEGQAITCKLGLVGENPEAPLLIAACDNGMLWDKNKYQQLIDDQDVNVIVWSFRHYPSSERNPQMYGWIKADEKENVQNVSVKKAISADPYNDHAIVGTFYFRKVRYFLESVKRLVEKNVRVNNEFYVDSCINELVEMGLKIKVFEIDHYVCWGTPDDLKIYEYWQSFFHKCAWHPYNLENDITINKVKISVIQNKAIEFQQEFR